jgi:small subunit ribosomal protein S3
MKKIELENYVKSQLESAGFTNLEIVKTPLVTRIVLHVVRPGLAIGKGGTTINQLTQEIGKRFGIENPQIEIQEIKNPELDAKANVDKIVSLLERGYSWRSVTFKAMQDIMNAKAQGAELILSGKLAGKGGRKRRVRIAQGYIKKVGNQVNLVDFAKANAYPKPGAIGIKLRIIHPGVEFPDKTDIRKFIEKEKEAVASETGQDAEKEVSAVEVETAKKEISEAKEKAETLETAKPVSKTAKKRTAKKAKEKKSLEKEEGKNSKEQKKSEKKKKEKK